MTRMKLELWALHELFNCIWRDESVFEHSVGCRTPTAVLFSHGALLFNLCSWIFNVFQVKGVWGGVTRSSSLMRCVSKERCYWQLVADNWKLLYLVKLQRPIPMGSLCCDLIVACLSPFSPTVVSILCTLYFIGRHKITERITYWSWSWLRECNSSMELLVYMWPSPFRSIISGGQSFPPLFNLPHHASATV